MYRKRVASALFLAFYATSSALPQAEEFYGKLETKLRPDLVQVYQRAYAVSKEQSKLKFSPPLEKDSVVSVGELIDQRLEMGKSTALLVEPAKGPPFVSIDLNLDGMFDAAERFVLNLPVDRPNDFVAVLQLPIKNTFYKTFPIYFHYLRGFKHPKLTSSDRLIMQSVYALAFGKVLINNRSVLFQYPFEMASPSISTTEGLFGVDADLDGRVLNQQFSRETSYAAKDEVVFPLGDMFVSTSSIDMAANRIVVRKRTKAEYLRVDLEVGMEMPNFSFVDLEGRARKLSDFRGKYLMVDFWGVWCVDCTRETPHHLAAYEKFRKRGFEILGLNTDEKAETAKDYLSKNKIVWPQSTNDSIRKLVEVTYRIQEYPSTILLGPDGKVLVLDQRRLQGDALLETLEKILPR